MSGLTLDEAAERLGITALELDHLRHASPVPIRMVRIERHILYDPASVDYCRRFQPRLLRQLAKRAGYARQAEAAAERAARSRRRAAIRQWLTAASSVQSAPSL